MIPALFIISLRNVVEMSHCVHLCYIEASVSLDRSCDESYVFFV